MFSLYVVFTQVFHYDLSSGQILLCYTNKCTKTNNLCTYVSCRTDQLIIQSFFATFIKSFFKCSRIFYVSHLFYRRKWFKGANNINAFIIIFGTDCSDCYLPHLLVRKILPHKFSNETLSVVNDNK